MNDNRRTFAKNAGSLMIAQLITWAIAIGLTIFVPRFVRVVNVGKRRLADSVCAMVGVVVTFHTMEVSGAGVELSQLSGGMMQAMITTVAGLIIGIPAYIGYNLLVARVNKVVQKMEATTIAFMDVLESPAK